MEADDSSMLYSFYLCYNLENHVKNEENAHVAAISLSNILPINPTICLIIHCSLGYVFGEVEK